MFNMPITSIVKNILGPYIKEGQIGVDLTAGNGFDTCFLAEKIGKSGTVYAFDVQALAIQNTEQNLKEKNLLNQVHLIQDSHENLELYIHGEINVAMMNLGYLPNGDKNIITRPGSTIEAIEKVIKKLDKGGILSIVLYYGHQGGMEEKEKVEEYLRQIDEKVIDIMTISYLNRIKFPPIILLIHKR